MSDKGMTIAKLPLVYLRGALAHFVVVNLWPVRHLDRALLLWRWAWEYAEWEAICRFEGERFAPQDASHD